MAVGALSGCSASSAPQPSGAVSTSAPTTAPVVKLIPDGTAEQNLPLFASVVNKVAQTSDKAKGRAYINALAAAGFATSAMQATNDTTSVNLPADSITFSVNWKGKCLVGQVGPSIKKPTSKVLPELPGGGCLIGDTRPITG